MCAWCDALKAEVTRLKAERLKLDRRIHNQRKANRDNWEIVEMRQNAMGSPRARQAYVRLLKMYRKLRQEVVQ